MAKRGRPPKKFDPDGFSPNLDGVAEHLGISLRALHNAIKRFGRTRPKHRAGGPYPLRAYKLWADRHGVTGRAKDSELVEERDIKLEHARLRLERERFEFEQLKDRMLPVSQFELALSKMVSAFVSALNAFTPRVNERLEGLDFNDRAQVLEEEMEGVKRTLAKCDFLRPDADGNGEFSD
jgi:hypothetical protein